MQALVAADRLSDGVVELRSWQDSDVPAVHAAREGAIADATSWVQNQQQRQPAVGISCAIAPPRQTAVGYVGLIRRPQVELGVRHVLEDGTLAFQPHQRVVGIGYWIAPDKQRHGFATRAVVLISRWALQSAGVTRIEALIDPRNVASRRVVENSGFRQEGQLRCYLQLDGEYTDALVFSMLQTDVRDARPISRQVPSRPEITPRRSPIA